MNYRQKYYSTIKNFEDRFINVFIYDTFSGDPNPYNINVAYITGGSDILVRIFFNDLPAAATGVTIGYSADGGATWTDSAAGLTSPAEITIPNTQQYLYRLIINYADSSLDETFRIDELDGVTDILTPAADPFHLISNNNSEDKQATISTLQFVMQFNAQDNNLLNKLLRGTYSDKRYFVTAAISEDENDLVGRFFFKGFLSLRDVQEPFMPRPVIRLTANDGLGSLKNKTMKDFYGNTPIGNNQIINFLCWCLLQTGIEENLNAVMNIRGEDDGTITDEPDKHFFITQYLHVKTFEVMPGEYENPYDVLSKILKRLARLGQRHGEWWVKNFDEFDFQPDNVAVFTKYGEFIEGYAATFTKEIGNTEGNRKNLRWLDHSAAVAFTSPGKKTTLLYRYETPDELPCNVDFERGEELPGGTADEKHFELECWDKLFSNTSTDDPATANIYIRRLYELGYEKERAVVISATPDFNFILSEGVAVGVRDKIILDVTRRMMADTSGSGFYRDNHVQVRLYGDDGSFWTCQGKNSATSFSQWVECTSTFRTNQKFFSIEGDISESQLEGKSLYDGESAEMPVAGTIKILVYQSSQFGTDSDTIIERVSFELYNFINGSHQKYTGQQHKIEKDADDTESVDDEVYISDAPAKELKGALKKVSGTSTLYTGALAFNDIGECYIAGNYLSKFNTAEDIVITGTTLNNKTDKITNVRYSVLVSSTVIKLASGSVAEAAGAATIAVKVFSLTGLFWNAAVFPLGVPSPDYYHPFGYIQAFNVMNQIRLMNRIMRGSIKGIESDTVDERGKCDLPTLFHSYYLRDTDEHTNGKKFMLLNYDIDLYRCKFDQASLKEVHDEIIGKIYSDPYEFKYLTR